MQNFNTENYLINNKIINMKSEILCREAEDDYFYFHKINTAYKKLCEAVHLTPHHTKSLILLADVCFTKGNIKKALGLYLRANSILPLNTRIIGAIANCFNTLQEYDKAVEYCDKAINKIRSDELTLFSQLCEIKINSLISQKKYRQAFNTYKKAKNILGNNPINSDYRIDYNFLNKKIKLIEKIQHSQLKVI